MSPVLEEDDLLCHLGKIRLFAAPDFTRVLKYEKLNHRINHEDGMAYIKRKNGIPITRYELRNYIASDNSGRPLFPNQS